MYKKTASSRHNRVDAHGLTDTVTVCPRPAQAPDRQNPSTDTGSGNKALPFARKDLQVISAGRGEIGFLQRSDTGYLNHTPGQAPGLQTFGQHKTNSMFLVACFYFVFKRERT